MRANEAVNEEIYAVRLKQGDETAFRYVMIRYFPVILSFARQFISDKSIAEDVAEDTFIKLWHHHDRVGSFRSIKAFLFIAAKNGCLNELRKEKNLDYRHKRYAANQDRESDFIVNEIIRAEVKAEIYKAVECLPEKMKRVFQLGFIEGLPNRDIASELDVSVNTVKAQKLRAIKLVKEKLRNKDIFPLALLLLSSFYRQ